MNNFDSRWNKRFSKPKHANHFPKFDPKRAKLVRKSIFESEKLDSIDKFWVEHYLTLQEEGWLL